MRQRSVGYSATAPTREQLLCTQVKSTEALLAFHEGLEVQQALAVQYLEMRC